MVSNMSVLLQIHVGAALIAIATGAVLFFLPKGGVPHRRWAYAYVSSMIVTTGIVVFVPATVLEFGDSGWGFSISLSSLEVLARWSAFTLCFVGVEQAIRHGFATIKCGSHSRMQD